MLIANENLVNVVWVSRASGKFVLQHLKNMLDPGGIIDVYIRYAITGVVHEKRQLQVSIMVWRFETSGPRKTGRWMMQAGVGRMEQSFGNTVLRFFSQLLGHCRKKSVAAYLTEFLDVREHRTLVC